MTLVEILPDPDQPPQSRTVLYQRMPAPRPRRADFLAQIERLVRAGEVEAIPIAGRVYYRRNPPVRGIAPPRIPGYTTAKRIEYSLDANVDGFLQALAPLRDSKVVKLWMDDPLLKTRKGYTGPTRRLIVLVPSRLIGLADQSVLCSVLGKGSFFIGAGSPPKELSNALLAGVPSALTKVLVSTVYAVLKET